MHALYLQKRRERNHMVYILAGYMWCVQVCLDMPVLGDMGCIDGFQMSINIQMYKVTMHRYKAIAGKHPVSHPGND